MEEKKDVFEKAEETVSETTDNAEVVEPAAETVMETADAVEETVEAAAETVTETVETVSETTAESAAKEPGKSKKGLFIGLGAAAVVAVGAFAAVTLSAKDPKTVVIDAFKNVYSDERVTPVEEIFGFGDMYEYAYTAPMEGGMELKLDWMDTEDASMQMFQGAGFRLDEQMDFAGRQANVDMAAIYGGMDLISAKVYMDNDKIAIASPELISNSLVWNYREEIPADSILGKSLATSGLEMDMTSYMSNYMDYIWSMYDTENRKFDVKELWERYKTGSKAIDDFKTAMVVEKADKATFTVDGKEASCKGYDVTITKDALVQFLNTTSDFFLQDETIKKDVLEYLVQMTGLFGNNGEILKQAYGGETPEEIQTNLWTQAETGVDDLIQGIQDHMGDTITMKVYVDSKGNLAAFDANTSITDDADTVNVELHTELKGGYYPTQNMDVKLILTQPEGDSVEMSLLKQGMYDGNQLTSDVSLDVLADDGTISGSYTGTYAVDDGTYHMEFMATDGATSGSVSIMGNITDLEKGKGFTMNMDEIALKMENTEKATLSGSYYWRPFEGEITMPEGEEFNMITATEGEWTELGNEASMNLFSIVMQLLAGGASAQ